MKKNIYFVTILSCIAIPCMVLFAQQAQQQFVIKKKRARISKSKLKERNAEKLATILHALPSHIKAIADLQETVMDRVSAYIEGEKNCFWTNSSSNKLDTCLHKIEAFEKQLDEMQGQLNNFLIFLRTL